MSVRWKCKKKRHQGTACYQVSAVFMWSQSYWDTLTWRTKQFCGHFPSTHPLNVLVFNLKKKEKRIGCLSLPLNSCNWWLEQQLYGILAEKELLFCLVNETPAVRFSLYFLIWFHQLTLCVKYLFQINYWFESQNGSLCTCNTHLHLQTALFELSLR